MKHLFTSVLLAFLLSCSAFSQYLRVSENHRFLVKDDGTPFFWLGDTGWEMFHRLNRQEIEQYLRNRSGKGFTVIQAVILSEINGLTVPNREGNLPLKDLDPLKPNEAYFSLVDYAIDKAAEFGLYMAVLPTWGSHAENKPHPFLDNMHIFTPENAYQYGKFLGSRYRDKWNVVWILGGDRPADAAPEIWDAMAKGLRDGDNGKHLISYHPMGQQSSSFWLQDKDWLDFNMIQTGHQATSFPVYNWISHDYDLTPIKPVFIGEPAYEDIPVWFNPDNPRHGDYEVRKQAYWAVFAGAFGHTYGNNNIWQMYRKEYAPIIYARIPWNEALEQPGAEELKHLRYLMESRPFLTRIPAQDLLEAENPDWSSERIGVTRDGTPGINDATYIMLYTPIVRNFSVKTTAIPGKKLKIWWYDPRTGDAFPQGTFDNTGTFSYSAWQIVIEPTQDGPDWVVVIDDADLNYPPPGIKGQNPAGR